ncbi:FGGY-family carbohydrate kinase [Parahaliea mediterranea]|uniref:FGGY-family carbohydrate kinase n=1 Tax=Parahaliea mediterranea TaxID=651086 RepID=UPI000E2FBBE4|nr:FGGY family carbohydrate kinase [Parahaliea mediterranea]
MSFTFILDIGKTNIKALVLDDAGDTCWSVQRANAVADSGPYPHFDVEAIWQWLLQALGQAAARYRLDAINISTHGACAVLLDASGELALPVMDYECPLPEAVSPEYNRVRPPFAQSLSPALPAGLNLGRQLWWQRAYFPEAFARVRTLLCYPQYWVWRLCGVAVSERTSLGCHTDLWLPLADTYSPLLQALGLKDACPPQVDACAAVGAVSCAVAQATGLPSSCQVFAGVHDSNASYARYLACAAQLGGPFSVVSTGTWFITMSHGGDCQHLNEACDTLANVDVNGRPLACARFMGGREFEAICERAGDEAARPLTQAALQATLDSGAMALPAFAAGGPFNGSSGCIKVPEGSTRHGAALATLYLALMIDYELDLLGARGPIAFGSLSQRNPLLCGVLAALRPDSPVLLAGDGASTARGAWCLTRWHRPLPNAMGRFTRAAPLALSGLADYRRQWRSCLM